MKKRHFFFVAVLVAVMLFVSCDINKLGETMQKGNKNFFFPVKANEETVVKVVSDTNTFIKALTSTTSMNEEEKKEMISSFVESIASQDAETVKGIREKLNSTTVSNYEIKNETDTIYGALKQMKINGDEGISLADCTTPSEIANAITTKANDTLDELLEDNEDLEKVVNKDKVEEIASTLGEIWAGESGLVKYYNANETTQAGVMVNEIINQSFADVQTIIDEDDVSTDDVLSAAINLKNSMTALAAVTGNDSITEFVDLIGQFVNLSGLNKE